MTSFFIHFSYSFLPVGPTENVVGNLASVNYVTDLLIRDVTLLNSYALRSIIQSTVHQLISDSIFTQKTDYVLGALIGTPGRNQVSDLASYWYIGPFGFIVPYPSKSIDVKSALKIFTLEVTASFTWLAVIELLFKC